MEYRYEPQGVCSQQMVVDIEDGIRLERALDRERRQASPNYDELCRRFLADNKDFSLENLSNLDINKFYINYLVYNLIYI